jgi:hypothetical protein
MINLLANIDEGAAGTTGLDLVRRLGSNPICSYRSVRGLHRFRSAAQLEMRFIDVIEVAKLCNSDHQGDSLRVAEIDMNR